jgi:dihydropteroate synthase
MHLSFPNQIVDFSAPRIMGILNTTPDSFYDGGKYMGIDAIVAQAAKMLEDGADFIDIGGMSTRPGAETVTVEEEQSRVIPAIKAILSHFRAALISIDTIHAQVAEQAVNAGACMVNDVSAGTMDTEMIPTVARLKVPYVIMHMQGTPVTMQQNPQYNNVVAEVKQYLQQRVEICRNAGIEQLIIDPGFGFGKTVEHNYTLLKGLSQLADFNMPILAGVSRKSMVCKVIHQNPAHALNGTTAVNMLALLNGANILRVHDVKEAKEVVQIYRAYSA